MKAVVLIFLATISVADASDSQYPACKKRDQELEINNDAVISWKRNTPNQYRDRAFIDGTIVGVLKDRRSHLQLEVDLDPLREDASDHIEIIYNKEFGVIPPFRLGSEIVVCGDYITSNKATKRYQPSPMGAIIHWIHMSPRPERHEDGYMMIDGVVTGLDNPNQLSSTYFAPFRAFWSAWSDAMTTK